MRQVASRHGSMVARRKVEELPRREDRAASDDELKLVPGGDEGVVVHPGGCKGSRVGLDQGGFPEFKTK